MKPLTVAEAAYSAALIDGEGTIALSRQHSKTRNPSYEGTVQVANTDLRILRWLLVTTKSGNITPMSGSNVRHKKGHRWKLRVAEFEPFLREVLPYLVSKKEQALLLLEFLAIRPGTGMYPPTVEELIQKQLIWEELASLNKRGT